MISVKVEVKMLSYKLKTFDDAPNLWRSFENTLVTPPLYVATSRQWEVSAVCERDKDGDKCAREREREREDGGGLGGLRGGWRRNGGAAVL
jgi:hypothetical protein